MRGAQPRRDTSMVIMADIRRLNRGVEMPDFIDQRMRPT
jgi:hypothetical protein